MCEAVVRGERRPCSALKFAQANCSAAVDLERAQAVLDDMHKLSANSLTTLADFVGCTMALLKAHWHEVGDVALNLMLYGRLDGDSIEKLIPPSRRFRMGEITSDDGPSDDGPSNRSDADERMVGLFPSFDAVSAR